MMCCWCFRTEICLLVWKPIARVSLPAVGGGASTLSGLRGFFGSLFYLWNKMDFVPSVEMISETKATQQELVGT